MSITKLRIGLFGGGFDPIHVGHLLLAETARQEAGLDKVIFMPTGISPHRCGKTCYKVDAEHRYQMLLQATNNYSEYEVSRYEIDNKQKSYTVDTLQHLISTNSNANLYLILGGDMYLDLPNWYKVEEILQLTTPIVAARPNYVFGQQIPENHIQIKMPQLEISSTTSRQNVSTGKSIRFQVTKEVEKYILENGLYKT
ncbi:MAG: nicotinate-nucleotide adenylyltransferase [Planctomycetaceae bacterium]|jgi:nicotinate-nucleotide adenylyltransferase|nr:nicotinate-nucleotide adenylyltransferase [Planctomycetaceae bacterium]